MLIRYVHFLLVIQMTLILMIQNINYSTFIKNVFEQCDTDQTSYF